MFYFGARYYCADVGAFTSVDPAEQFWNRYAYTRGNPISYIDILGLADIHFMLGDTYSKKYKGQLISFNDFQVQLAEIASAFEAKGYTVQFDELTSATLNDALQDAQHIYTISHGEGTRGYLQGRDKGWIRPDDISERNLTTKMKVFGCNLANFLDSWRDKIGQFTSWNFTKTNNVEAMERVQSEAELDAILLPVKED